MAAHQVEQLADALAITFASSHADARACAVLHRLLPGLEHASVAVLNPAQRHSLVAAANCAAAGPTTLHMLDVDKSASGQAIARSKPLQASLLDGAAQRLAEAWSDVALMLAEAPSVRYMLVLPFGSGDSSSRGGAGSSGAGSSSGSHSSIACQLHSPSIQGALVLGFAAAPQLDAPRKAALALLAAHLPASLARQAAPTLAFANYAAGIAPTCSCCCNGDDADAVEACRPLDGVGPGSGSLPRQSLDIAPRVSLDSAADSECSSDSACQRRHGFSKALLAEAAAAADAGGSGLLAQHPLSLRFGSARAEREYRCWVLPLYRRADRISSLLMLAAMLVVALAEPFCLLRNAPGTLALGAGMALPLAFTAVEKELFALWRSQFMVAFRLYAILFASHAGIPALLTEAAWPRQTHGCPPLTLLWRLSGAECLAASGVGFLLRQGLHLPLQVTGVGIAAAGLPRICAARPGLCSVSCVSQTLMTMLLFGLVLPTLATRFVEKRCRLTFVRLLMAAAQ